MSDNPLIEGFLNLHEAGGVGGGMSGTKFSNAASYAPAVGAGVRGAFNNATMDKGKYARAAVDYIAKNSGSLAGVSEPTTFDKELEQENEKDIAAQRDYPVAYDIGDKVSTAAQVVSGVGAAKALGTAVLKAGIKATTKNTAKTVAKNFDASDFELGVKNVLDLTPEMRVAKQSYPNLNKPPFNQTLQAKPYSAPKPTLNPTLQTNPYSAPKTTLNPTPQPKTYPKFTREENDSSEGNTEMSTNPYIKGFFDIEEARAKNTNIFDESKKLTAAQKKNLDKNDNDKIDAEDFEMLRKEKSDLDESDFKQRQSVNGLKKMIDDHDARAKNTTSPLKKDHHRKMSQQLRDQLADMTKESDLDEAKKNNAMVMAGNISKVLKAVKPDFLDIDKDGDKEESMKKAAADKKIDEANILPSNFSDRETPLPNKIAYAIDKENSKKKKPVSLKKAPFDMKEEEVEFSEEEIDFINNVMEAMPVAPTSEGDSPNPTPKKKAEGSRAKGSMAD